MTRAMGDNSDPFPQLGSVYGKSSCFSQVKRENVANTTIKFAQDGKIEPKGRDAQYSDPSPWGRSNLIHKLGMQSTDNPNTIKIANLKNFSSNGNEMSFKQKSYNSEHRWNDFVQIGQVGVTNDETMSFVDKNEYGENIDCEDDSEEVFGSSDDDDLLNDSDVDISEKSLETCKRNKRFKTFFSDLDKLTAEELNSPARKWHCPACKGGPGAIDWYRGLEPLMYHAMTRKTRRAKLHRLFAEILDKEARRRGISVTLNGVASGRWEGLNEKVEDRQIVWPPMVVIMNTRCEQEDNGKWIGMGSQELLDHFKSFAALKARHAYGPQGHRGMSVLIFDDSAAGYLEADRLDKHFNKQGRGRDAWNSNRVPFCSGGRRQLYGFIALEEDLNIFNQHSQGRSKLKFEMRSYQEMVAKKIKEINDNKQQLVKCKDKIAKGEKHIQVLAESIISLSQELHKSLVDRHDMRRQTKLVFEGHKKELDSQEKFFNEQLKVIYEAIEGKEDNADKLQQLNSDFSKEKESHRMENIGSLKNIKGEKMKYFEAEWEELLRSHLEKETSILKKYWEELLELEKVFGNELSQLREKYINNAPQSETSNSQSTV